MINPISSAAHGATGAGSLNEAVVRFGAAQESREQQRTERATDEEKTEGHIDQVFIESPEEAPQEGQAPPRASGGQSSGQSQRTSGRDENSISGRGPGQDGAQEAQEQAIAQHAAEQHGKRELVKGDVDRSQRSTREMMGRIESKGGVDEPHSPKGESGGAASSQKSAPSGGARGEAPASSHHGPAPGGGGHAAVAGSGTPRLGSDVIAAAVGSGLATTEEVAPGTAQSSDADDDHGQQEDSSQESVKSRGEDQGKRVSRERSLDGQAGFHDGDGGREDSRKKFGQESGSGRQEGRDAQTANGGQSDEQPQRENAPELAAAEVAAPPDLAPAPPEESTSVFPDTTDASSPQPPADVVPPAPPATDLSTAAASTPQPPQAPLAEPQPPTIDRLPVVDAYERSVASTSTSGVSLLGDEYFFFDDARTTPDAPASV